MTAEWVFQLGFQTIVTGLIGYLFAQFKAQKKKHEAQQLLYEKQQKATQAGVKALLKDRLIERIHKVKKRGCVYVFELENINSMFEEYKALGGNGAVLHMMKEVSKLPTKTELK